MPGATGKLMKRQGYGSMPVFLLALSTLLGAVMMLNFGYAVGHLGLLAALGMVITGHLVTIPTAMALSEIATNQKVEGGSEYFIISRSFGITVGISIGVALYLAQAILAAIYIMAFSRAFSPVFNYLLASPLSIYVYDYRVASIPLFIVLCYLLYRKGIRLLISSMYVLVPLIILGIVFFLLSDSGYRSSISIFDLSDKVSSPDSFFQVFALCFPAFCGMTAGLGLSGKLKEPRRALPRGILAATVVAFFVYVLVIYKLYMSASPSQLAHDILIMADISVWGGVVVAALAGVSFLSAVGSLLMAGRTLQAMAADRIFPNITFNRWLGKMNRYDLNNPKPQNAMLVTGVVILCILAMDNLELSLEVVSVLFCLTYGFICLISFLEHFAADPAYRPSFRSKWFISFIGAVSCLVIMLNINWRFSLLFLSLIIITYFTASSYHHSRHGLATIFQGVTFQLSRRLQIFLQKVKKEPELEHWRPSVICISTVSFERMAAFNMLRWIAYKYGFGTYIHLIHGYLSKETNKKSRECLKHLIQISDTTHSNVYIDTLVSPSITSAISQVIQLPGISGKENNVIMFEFSKNKMDGIEDIVDNFKLVKATDFDVLILGSSDRNFGYRKEIDIWITSSDYENATLMILLAYILLGHPEWRDASIKILAIYPEDDLPEQKQYITELINSGRLPISLSNVELIAQKDNIDTKTIINKKSVNADLTIIGIRSEAIKHNGEEVFQGYDGIGDVMFVNTKTMKLLR